MPSVWKKITFSVASVLCIGSVVLLVVALATERWATGRILCKTGVEIVNASSPELEQFMGHMYYGLFQGGKTKKCGLGDRRSKIYIFPKLVRTLNSGLHMMVILFLLVAIGFALVSLSFSLFGTLGVLCFLAAMKHHRLTERVANYRESLFRLTVLDDSLDWSFWLGVASAVTHVAVCGVVAMSRIKLPKAQKKKPEQPSISALDLLY
ncbi:hypothetical protein CRUP_032166 [Coryphaenoides rupestris]|nr:hypothetical protein CRUP_032166 [Coryphaenoides rupestris]